MEVRETVSILTSWPRNFRVRVAASRAPDADDRLDSSGTVSGHARTPNARGKPPRMAHREPADILRNLEATATITDLAQRYPKLNALQHEASQPSGTLGTEVAPGRLQATPPPLIGSGAGRDRGKPPPLLPDSMATSPGIRCAPGSRRRPREPVAPKPRSCAAELEKRADRPPLHPPGRPLGRQPRRGPRLVRLKARPLTVRESGCRGQLEHQPAGPRPCAARNSPPCASTTSALSPKGSC
jgi:hypothetical protein